MVCSIVSFYSFHAEPSSFFFFLSLSRWVFSEYVVILICSFMVKMEIIIKHHSLAFIPHSCMNYLSVVFIKTTFYQRHCVMMQHGVCKELWLLIFFFSYSPHKTWDLRVFVEVSTIQCPTPHLFMGKTHNMHVFWKEVKLLLLLKFFPWRMDFIFLYI